MPLDFERGLVNRMTVADHRHRHRHRRGCHHEGDEATRAHNPLILDKLECKNNTFVLQCHIDLHQTTANGITHSGA